MRQPPAPKETCKRDHPLAGENLSVLMRSGRPVRICRACARDRQAAHRAEHPRPSTATGKRPDPVPLIERVLARIDRNGPVPAHRPELGPCWLWTGAVTNGYGIAQRGRRGEGTVRVHRIVYEHFKGPLPRGLDAMHACHVRNCANPDHLEAGTRAENMAQSQKDGRLRRHALTRTNA